MSGTASRTGDGIAATLINRHYRAEASVSLVCADAPPLASGKLLASDRPQAQNSVATPERVAPKALRVAQDGDGRWRVELPPHSMATVMLRCA